MGKRGSRGNSVKAEFPWREWQQSAFGVLRWTPDTFWNSSLSEFLSALEGFAIARGGKKQIDAPSQDQLDDLISKYGS
ncbi:phage tail assembly chaperone [Brucella sp. H1_1004]|uniref:phage tail assembly chaperone n=1 Tax=Brucella sp. H1_1004 TaxID=3110109 RepID=UPI0039B5F377